MDLSEIKTITQAKQGDKLALLALYDQYLPLFKKLCRNRADYSNVLEVDDLLQECFLALESATNSYSFEREASFKTYLYSCVKWHLTRVIAKANLCYGFALSGQWGQKIMSKITPLKAIRRKCLECCAGQRLEVRECLLKTCPLFPFRMGHRPPAEQFTTESIEIDN